MKWGSPQKVGVDFLVSNIDVVDVDGKVGTEITN
jgi:hypothetical protein